MVTLRWMAGAALWIATMLAAAATPITNEEIVREGNGILEAPEKVLGKDVKALTEPPSVSEEQRQAIEAIARRAGSIVDGAMNDGQRRVPERLGRSYRLFVSRAMGDAALKEIFALSASRDDLTVVFRGFAPGEKFGEFQRNLQPLLGEIGKDTRPPAVTIDPPKFTEAGVTAVPALAAYDDGKLIAVVHGVTSIDWMADQVANGARGRLGQQGSVVEIAEVDVLALMQKRAAEYDWQAAKGRATQGFWQRQHFVRLPRAIESRTRLIDPTITIKETIKGARGEIIALAGSRVNPLESIPFRQRLVVFDGLDRAQVAAVKAYREENRKVTFITTQVDPERGFDHLGEVMAELGTQVSLLTPEIANRFGIEKVPSIIEAKGNRFEVKEVPVQP